MSENKREVFISYRRSDNANNYVEKLHKSLEEMLGKGVFFDQKDLWKWSKDGFPLDLRNAIDNCYCFLCIVSQDYLTLREDVDWCEEELKHAKERHVPVVAIVLDNATETGDFKRINPEGSNHCRTDGKEPSEHDKLISWLKSKTAEFSVGFDTSSESVDENSLRRIVELIFNTMFLDGQRTSFDEFLNKQMFTKEDVGESIHEDIKDWITFKIKKQKTNEEIAKETKKTENKPFEIDRDTCESDMDAFCANILFEKRSVITGNAGQGKSIYLKQLCNKLSEVLLERQYSRNELFPIYAELKRIDGCLTVDNDIIDAIARATQNGMTKEMLKCVIRNGMPCFLFDGIDEISPERFIAIKALLENCDDLIKENVRMVFTSRPGQQWLANNADVTMKSVVDGNARDVIVRRWKLDAISDDIFDSFAEKVFNAIPMYEINSNATAEEFIGALKAKENEDKRYVTISRNAFMLKMVSKYFAINKSLPNTKIEAFDHAVNDIVDRDIKREKAQGDDSSFADDVKQVLGKIAFELYKAKDGNNARGKFVANDAGVKDVIEDQFKRDKKAVKELDGFFEKHKLVDQNGFVHDLFTCYYCAFYIYKELDQSREFGLKELTYAKENMEKDYWRGVVEMLICLVEYNAKGKWQVVYQELLDTMLTSMQTEVKKPNYNLLCEAVVQFIDKNNRALAEKNLILGMLERGERGVKSFNRKEYTCSDGANPYDELFYYVELYDLFSGLRVIFDERSNCQLSPIQSHLFNELCEVIGKPYFIHNKKITKRIKNLCLKLSSMARILFGYETANYGHVVFSTRNILKNIATSVWEDFVELGGGLVGMIPTIIDAFEDQFDEINMYEITSLKIDTSLIGRWGPHPKLKYVCSSKKHHKIIDGCVVDLNKKTCILGTNKTKQIPDDIKVIASGAFAGCENLSTNIIPNGVTRIGYEAFYRCAGLTKLIIPNSVKSIGGESFCRCKNLTSVIIPNSVKKMGDSPFRGCTSLTNIALPNCFFKNKYRNPFDGCKNLRSITIPSGVKKIRNYTFSCCTGLTNITIPDSVEKIEDGAFSSCNGLTKIKVGRSVKHIERNAFYGCYRLAEVQNNSSLDIVAGSEKHGEIGYYAKHIYKNDNDSRLQVEGDYIVFQNGAEMHLLSYTGLEREIIIPDYITHIGDYAFRDNDTLLKVTIPDSVISIGKEAFYGCVSLISLTIGSEVKYIEEYAFSYCYLIEVYNKSKIKCPTTFAKNVYTDANYVSKLYKKGDYIFYKNNDELALVVYLGNETQLCIPSEVNHILSIAFKKNCNIESVEISNPNTMIDKMVFSNCNRLTSLYLPVGCKSIDDAFFAKGRSSSLKIYVNNIVDWCKIDFKYSANPLEIGHGSSDHSLLYLRGELVTDLEIPSDAVISRFAFSGYCRLQKVNIDRGVTSISDYAFESCMSLESITLPNSVTNIGRNAFRWCGNLSNVFFYGTSEQWGDIDIGEENECLLNAKRYYYSENEPIGVENIGEAWHFAEDGKTPIVWGE